MRGRIAARLRVAGITPARLTLAGLGAVLVMVGILDFATRPPPMPDYAQVRAAWQPSEAWLYDRHGVLIDSARVNFAARRLGWTPLARIAPPVRDVIVAAEDKRFFAHGGVDWLALAGAARDRVAGKAGRGASTLTMQLAAYLAPELAAPGARGWRDKLRQMRAAWAIEQRWTKDEVLEAYLNRAGFRGEAQGVGAAALALFGKTPDALSRGDALLLAALLPDPQATAPALAKRACAYARRVDCRGFEASAWAMLGPQRSLALDPGLAPHLATRLLTSAGARITTTLDAQVQRLATVVLTRQLQGLGAGRARDGAVIVVDNDSGDVRAYVGGVGGASTARDVDGAAAYRQAGSTLKPFLYAQAIERGYLTS
ncbi:MAG: penicillin-binding protein 1C, partial [Zymomonas sp.]|nr:penicillin-binding protein 1C [Zymomonas sp.]